MNLDWLASALCGVIAICLFVLHVVSSPRRTPWLTLPQYVRWGLVTTGATFLWRSVNFTTIAAEPLALGHINAEGMLALICFTYTVAALTVWAIRTVMPSKVRLRSEWATQEMKRNPDLHPVLLPTAEVADVAKLSGFQVAAKPKEIPRELGGDILSKEC